MECLGLLRGLASAMLLLLLSREPPGEGGREGGEREGGRRERGEREGGREKEERSHEKF